MTFCSDKQKENEIIDYVEYKDNFFTIYYLDNSEATFYNTDKEFIKKLEEKLINQAKERELDYKKIQFDKWFSLITSLVSINITNISLNKNMLTLACVGFIISLILINKWRKNLRKTYEIIKYKILLNNYNEFKNNSNISKIIKCKELYEEPVNIFTIDKFSLDDIKLMKKSLKNKDC